MSFIQPLTLQRLIDGELDSASMQSLLREADGQPEIWKEIAAAFIEDRAWQNSFVDCSLPADTNSILGSSPAEQVSLKNENANHNKRWRWLFSLAAAVLLATFVGYMIGNQQPAGLHTGAGLANVVTSDDSTLSGADEITKISYEPDYRMQLDDKLNSEIPLYNANRAKELGLSLEPASISDSLQKFAKNSGYELDENLRYISGQMNNGQRFVVPVRRIQFIPGQ